MPKDSTYFGLTGGVASGKSTVAAMFREFGARIIDADEVGHELLRHSSPAFHEVLKRFGNDILDAAGEIDRKRLGGIVFTDAAKLGELNAILHPKIIARVEELADEHSREDRGAVVLVDAALIYEAGIGGRFSKMVVAWSRPEQQIERLIAKTGLPREEAERRVAAQMPIEVKRRRADYVVDCSGSLEETRWQVREIYVRLKQLLAKGT